MLEEQEAPVVDPWESGSEPALEALRLVLALDGVLNLLPLDPERWIGEQVVEGLPLMAVLGERVPEDDVGCVLPFDHQVRAAHGVGLGVQFLAEDFKSGVGVEVAKMLFGHGEHPPGAARRVEQA